MANWWEADSMRGDDGPAPRRPGGNGEACPPGERRVPNQDGWTCMPDGSTPAPPPSGPATCPPDKPYMNDGQCDKCPEGQWTHNGVCEARSAGSGGNNGSNSGGSGGGVAPKAPPRTVSPYDAEMSKLLFEQLQAMINGEGQPFSPEVVAKMNAGLLGSNKAQLETSQRDLQKRLIASGLSRSGVAPAEQGRLRSRADASLSDGFRQTAITAIQGNYAAKAQALAQAQTFLNSERANALSTDQLTFGYAQLAQQWKALQAQFDQQKWLANNGNEQDLLRLLLQLQNGGL